MKTIPVGSAVILPTAQMAQDILARFERLAEDTQHPQLLKALSIKPKSDFQGVTLIACAEMIKAMYLDLLQEVAAWNQFVSASSQVDLQWATMIPEWKDVPASMGRALFTHVLREAYEEIHDWALKLDGGRVNWNIWYARCIGLDLMLERGEDFRIADWNRRMELGREKEEQQSADAWKEDDDLRYFARTVRREQGKSGLLSPTLSDKIQAQQNQKAARPTRRRLKRAGER